jgi:ABC-type nickel/cobalt efflux system permease component RcnA
MGRLRLSRDVGVCSVKFFLRRSLVPCTGAVLILLYAMANDILLAGMMLVAAIAAGMAMTMGGSGS